MITPESAEQSRFESIRKAHSLLRPCAKVIIAEAAVPVTKPQKIVEGINALNFYEAAALVLEPKWTSIIEENGMLQGVYNRFGMVDEHTPEFVRYTLLSHIVQQCTPDIGFSTIFMAVHVGCRSVALLQDDPTNVKVTYPHDLHTVAGILEAEHAEGNGTGLEAKSNEEVRERHE